MTREQIEKELQRVARQFSEHGDAIQILFTVTEEGATHLLKIGAGNWCARKGICQQFLDDDKQIDQANRIADVMPHPPKEDEEW